MQNRQNYDPNAAIYHCNSLILVGEQEFEAENGIFNSGPPQNDPNSEAAIRGSATLFDRLDLLAVDSLCTISRGSLDIAPDPPSMDVNTNIEEEIPSTSKSSHKSFIFEERDGEEESERKLIIKTEELSLRGEEEEELRADIFNEYSPRKHRPLVKNERPKIRHIKHAKQLIRELKRQHKYNDRILADVVIAIDNKISKVKNATIEPIISEKGHLSGLIVDNDQTEFKIRVINRNPDSFDPQLELWEEQQQSWVEFQFKIKIRSA